MQLASHNYTSVCPIILAKAEVRDKFKLITAFRSRRKLFTFFTFWIQLCMLVCLKVHECLTLYVRSEDSHCKARLSEHKWGYWVGFSSILGVYLQVLSKHSWYFMSHSSYQSSSPTQPKEVKQSHLQSRHPASQLHHISHYTDCTDSRAIDCNSALDKAGCVHLPIHLRRHS